jgi:hypothetical protein
LEELVAQDEDERSLMPVAVKVGKEPTFNDVA